MCVARSYNTLCMSIRLPFQEHSSRDKMGLSKVNFVLLSLLFVPNVCDAYTKKDVVDTEAGRESDTTLTIEDFVKGQTLTKSELSELGIETKADPTLGSRAEGDIAIANLSAFVESSNQPAGRAAERAGWRRWPNGEVPYVLSSRYGKLSRRVIANAMDQFHKKSCVRFVPRKRREHTDYVAIVPDDGCYSLVGRTGGRQPLSLDAGCIATGTVMHEMMHTVGFFHEQSRNDRNDYVEIVWDNVEKEAKDQFTKYSLRRLTHLGLSYDYGSLMHYGPYAFSKNFRRTILAKQRGGGKMGQRDGFSQTDVKKLNKLYKCKDVDEQTTTRRPSTKTERTEQSECKDKNWRCDYWKMSLFNYCNKYETVRNEICRKSCGTCSADSSGNEKTTTTKRPTTTTSASTSTSGTPTSGRCKDLNARCKQWAAKGHCTRSGFKGYMAELCPKSCKICTGTSPECADSEGYKYRCWLAVKLDRCHMSKYRKHCRKSCELC